MVWEIYYLQMYTAAIPRVDLQSSVQPPHLTRSPSQCGIFAVEIAKPDKGGRAGVSIFSHILWQPPLVGVCCLPRCHELILWPPWGGKGYPRSHMSEFTVLLWLSSHSADWFAVLLSPRPWPYCTLPHDPPGMFHQTPWPISSVM